MFENRFSLIRIYFCTERLGNIKKTILFVIEFVNKFILLK